MTVSQAYVLPWQAAPVKVWQKLRRTDGARGSIKTGQHAKQAHYTARINPLFPQADLVIIIGANDVVNPAANTAEGTPIYGMPILNVSEARNVIVCNYDMKPGYAGVENPLYTQAGVTMLLGDASESVERLIRNAG